MRPRGRTRSTLAGGSEAAPAAHGQAGVGHPSTTPHTEPHTGIPCGTTLRNRTEQEWTVQPTRVKNFRAVLPRRRLFPENLQRTHASTLQCRFTLGLRVRYQSRRYRAGQDQRVRATADRGPRGHRSVVVRLSSQERVGAHGAAGMGAGTMARKCPEGHGMRSRVTGTSAEAASARSSDSASFIPWWTRTTPSLPVRRAPPACTGEPVGTTVTRAPAATVKPAFWPDTARRVWALSACHGVTTGISRPRCPQGPDPCPGRSRSPAALERALPGFRNHS